MKIKESLKKNAFLRKIIKNKKVKREYKKDYRHFISFYMENKETENQIEYEILLYVHSLEKGMSHKNLRPFGEKKVEDLISLLEKLQIESVQGSTSFKMGVSILKEWKNLYDLNEWEKSETYKKVEVFLKKIRINFEEVNVGTKIYNGSLYKDYQNYDYLEAISSRHSVRDFLKRSISNDDIEYCVKAAIKSPSACNRQMVKVYYIDTNTKKEALSNILMGLSGFNKENVNFFVFTYDVSAFSFYGERSQGLLNSGLFAMNFVNALHFKGIGSCFLQWGNTVAEEEKIKNILEIPENERIAIVLGAGYYVEKCLIPASERKKISEVFKKI